MTWISEDGTEHPSLSDEATAEGFEHIAGCSRCAENMPVQHAMITEGIA